jgi:DNA-binding GntR family transcriptional regulator
MRGVLAELRLAFHGVDDPRALHEPYLGRNQEILDALEAGDPDRAEELLAGYLDDSRARLVRVYAKPVVRGDSAER